MSCGGPEVKGAGQRQHTTTTSVDGSVSETSGNPGSMAAWRLKQSCQCFNVHGASPGQPRLSVDESKLELSPFRSPRGPFRAAGSLLQISGD